jgi:PadR family transcriptional regulator, regulatory protein PadR
MRQEALKGHLDGLVLAVLADGPLHGYAIREALAARTGGELSIEGGTLYPVLHRLEQGRLISGRWSVVQGRHRRSYVLTKAGRTALRRERAAWRDFVQTIGVVLDPQLG